MKVYAHTLFKNEERWLWYSVSSVVKHVDKMLLWDTGSSDNSWLIALKLKEKYKDKIDLRQFGEVTAETFYKARQAMLDETDSDWFIVVDGDEIWWERSIKGLISEMKKDTKAECFIVPTINAVGDIFHRLPDNAGRYKFKNRVGNYNLRAVKKTIPGIHSRGVHGLWGWADDNNRQIQERNTFKYVNFPYLHTTFLPRGEKRKDDLMVPKRKKKLKYEIGKKLPLDFYYPEVFFEERPDIVPSPWLPMSNSFILKAIIQLPFKKIKRKVFKYGVGY